MSCDTRTVVVTGASGGVGGAVCDHLESAGWNVVATDRLASDRAGAIQLDISDSAAVERVLGKLPRVDALVNNAALQLYRPLLETGIDEWEDVHRVNLRGPWLCVKALHRQLAARQGSVVNISSVHAVATSLSIGAYATMKGGLAAFTRAAALEFADAGVRVNTILPGAMTRQRSARGSGAARTRSHSSSPALLYAGSARPGTSPRSWPSSSTAGCRASSPAPRFRSTGSPCAAQSE